MRQFTLSSEEGSSSRLSSVCAACLRGTPWWTVLATAFLATGLALWAGSAVEVGKHAAAAASAIGVPASVTVSLQSGVVTTVLAVGITALGVCVLALALAALHAGLTARLHGARHGSGCCAGAAAVSAGKGASSSSSSPMTPEPWVFAAYRFMLAAVNGVVWLLLVAVVGVLGVMVAWCALSAAATSAIAASRAAPSAYGLRAGDTSNSVAAAQAYLAPLAASAAAVQELLGSSTEFTSLPFQPLCAPVCLNLGSLASLLRASSCVCGSARLEALATAASEGSRVGAAALAGAAAMYVGATLLLVVLAAQAAYALHDRSAARRAHRRAARDFENGYLADPRDCVAMGGAAGTATPPSSVKALSDGEFDVSNDRHHHNDQHLQAMTGSYAQHASASEAAPHPAVMHAGRSNRLVNPFAL